MLNQQKNYLKDCEYYRNLTEEEKLKKEIMLTLELKVCHTQTGKLIYIYIYIYINNIYIYDK